MAIGSAPGELAAACIINTGADELYAGSVGIAGLTTTTPNTAWTLTLTSQAAGAYPFVAPYVTIEQNAGVFLACTLSQNSPTSYDLRIVDGTGAPAVASGALAFVLWRVRSQA